MGCGISVRYPARTSAATPTRRSASGSGTSGSLPPRERLRDPGNSDRSPQVAYRFGFCDHAQFSRAFKAQFGITPKEFKMMQLFMEFESVHSDARISFRARRPRSAQRIPHLGNIAFLSRRAASASSIVTSTNRAGVCGCIWPIRSMSAEITVPDHEIAAARHRVAMQHDRLGAARHLDRAVGIAGIDDVRGIGAGAERLLARHEFERPAAAEAIADAVGLGRHLPGVREEIAGRLLGDAVPVEARAARAAPPARRAVAAQLAGDRAALLAAPFAVADRQLVAGLRACGP